MQMSAISVDEWVTSKTVDLPFIRFGMWSLHFALKAASPTESTSSIMRISGSQAVATEKPSLATIPEE